MKKFITKKINLAKEVIKNEETLENGGEKEYYKGFLNALELIEAEMEYIDNKKEMKKHQKKTAKRMRKALNV